MGTDTNTHQSAKGIYTFTQKEEVRYTYGVVASSWEEAKEKISSYDYYKIEAGDFMGGEYLYHTQMRRERLIRKKECTAEKFTLYKAPSSVKGWPTITHRYRNCSVSEAAIVAPVQFRDETPSEVDFVEYDERTGCCANCSNLLRNGWVMIPRAEPPTDAEYSSDKVVSWTVKEESQ